MENEVWKDILNFEGLYQVSNLGRVKSLDRSFTGRNQFGAEFPKIIKGQIITDRPKNKYSKYRRIGLRKEGKK